MPDGADWCENDSTHGGAGQWRDGGPQPLQSSLSRGLGKGNITVQVIRPIEQVVRCTPK